MRVCGFLFCVLFALVLGVTAATSCRYTNGTGASWDLTPLSYDPQGGVPSGYSFSALDGSELFINFCDQVASSIGNDACNENMPSGSCQYDSGNYFSNGDASTATFIAFVRTYMCLL